MESASNALLVLVAEKAEILTNVSLSAIYGFIVFS
jgi:hypothetical protein